MTGKKYSLDYMKTCGFDIIHPGQKKPTGYGSSNSVTI
jgi:hypothetical protein